MRLDKVMSNEFLVRWDPEQQSLLISHANADRAADPLIRVRGPTLDQMSWPEASRFIGQFFTLLVPDLRRKFAEAIGSGDVPGPADGA